MAYVAPGPYGGWAPDRQSRPPSAADGEAWNIAPQPSPWPRRAARGDVRQKTADAPIVPPSRRSPIASGNDIPGGDACLAELDRRRIPYESLAAKRGVDTPIAVRVPLGGVRYFTWGDAPMICDCRLAVALDELGPQLRAIGVTAAQYSGAYVYRTTRNGHRLSLHARGLAIDIHNFTLEGQQLSVKKDFARGRQRATGCAKLPPVNQVACYATQRALFHELLTPDSDADHHDHIHFGVAPLDFTPPSQLQRAG